MLSSINDGGSTHLKYGHFRFPRVIQVTCPACFTNADLTHIGTTSEFPFFIDTDQSSRIWTFFCPNCLIRKEVNWEDTKRYQLSNKIDIKSENISAWNADHLEYIIDVLSGKEKRTHAWAPFKTYIHGSWLLKINKPADIKKLIQLFEKNSGRSYSV